MALRSVTWILIIGYLVALAISAPTSYEEHSEEATTVGAVVLPAVLPTEKKIRREIEIQDADKSEGQKSEKPTESAYTKPTEASSRLARDTDEHKPEPVPTKPSGDTPDAKKDDPQHRDKRETEQKKNEAKQPITRENKPGNSRPQRDTTGGGQPQKQGASQPTANSGGKKEEKNH